MTSLRRTLRERDLVLIVIGGVIGSGIFIVPSAVLRQSGSVSGALVVWLVGGVLSLLGALTYGELGAMDPESGGLYSYIRDAFGDLPAFLYGWTLFFVISNGTVAALAVAATGYLGQFVSLGPYAARGVAALLIGVLAVVNIRGAREGADLQNWTSYVKIGGILLMSALLLVLGRALWGSGAATPVVARDPSLSLVSGVGLAMIAVLWAYEGWQYVTFSAGETVDPQRTFPRAITLGTAALIAIYLVANVAYLAALGPGGVAASSAVAGDAVTRLFGTTAGRVISLVIIVSMLGAANQNVLTAPRVYYTMAREGLFFRRLAVVDPRFGTPAAAIVASCAWAAVLAASGTFDQLLTYVVFVGWIFYGLGALSVIVLRRSRPDAPRPFRVPGYPLTPILFVAAALALVLNTIVSQPRNVAVGLAFVVLGVPAYYVWRARSRTAGVPRA